MYLIGWDQNNKKKANNIKYFEYNTKHNTLFLLHRTAAVIK